ncbi:M48 family metalloprotease [Terasakiella pusilla]|uniref:M48 family metalloprotease n=1 Tax=Terasakiella pusilla TaxID=64973 RepID=UPI00056E28EE|nr:M48 family metalloprotease [Terasakiella pusilla]
MKLLAPIAALGLLALSTTGCSVNPATGKQSFTGLMSEQQEQQVGKQEHPKILQQFGGAYDHAAMSQYVDDLGQRLAKVSELPNLKWTFTVLDDPIINAFALPGGYIYISRGLIGLAENEAELAAVLGHEIGHVTARHSAQRYSKSVLTGVGATLLGMVVGGPAGDLANYAGQAYIASYSRDHEMEADMLGIRYMTKLGYDPKASATFFKKLAEHTETTARMQGQKGQQSHYNIFASHPDTRSRIVASENIAKSYPADLNLTNRKVFLAQIDGLEYGPSIKQGIIEGQRFIHPDLRFRFDAPEGFTLINRPDLVAAIHDNGSTMVFQTTRSKVGKIPITQYLTSVWANKYNLQDVQPLRVDNLEAATGVTRINSKNGVRDVRYLAIADGDEIFKFQFLTPTNLTQQMELPFRRTTYSFKRLSYQEAKSIKGLHIDLHRVGRGDTITSLAQRMKVEKLQDDWFKVLNRETLQDGLQAGETVKLVVKDR